MTLTKRGALLRDILKHRPECSYDLIRLMGTNYPPRAAGELDTYLTQHPSEGKLVKDHECRSHDKCIRYRLQTEEPKPVPADPRER